MSLEDLLSGFTSEPAEFWSILVAILLSALLGLILSEVYKKFGQSLSNRRKFSLLLVPIAMTTALIITIVKSSLALSLGLVGALSIIRFRTAIKEPEELAYLFLSIAVGLGMGASLYMQTIVSFFVILGVIIFINFRKTNNELGMNFVLKSEKITIDEAVEIFKKNRCRSTLRRSSHEKEGGEFSFFIDGIGPSKIGIISEDLKRIDPHANISYFEAQVGI